MTTAISLNDASNIVHSGNTAVQSIQVARQVNRFVCSMGNIVSATFVAVCAAPFVLMIWVVLAYSVWRLSHLRLAKASLNSKNYKAFRLRFNRVNELADTLRPIAGHDFSQENWVVRLFAVQSVKAARIMLRHQNEMAAVLKQLDTPYLPLPDGWQVLTSNQRWESRPTPYDYLV